MSSSESLSTVELFHRAPAEITITVLAPVGLATGQLVNSAVHNGPILAPAGFAVAMLAFAIVSLGLCRARHHRWTLESALE
ncbi:hypothetical protein [Natronosalvus vescus]|uniref:hypothetical protein n=1 Tax=Natronosalvus vescus TaxID=2953881 RepID=UPI002091AC6E|nr:hypothetical protein [Natronosalvus vescus]